MNGTNEENDFGSRYERRNNPGEYEAAGGADGRYQGGYADADYKPYGSQQNPYGGQQNPYSGQQNPYGGQQNPYGASYGPYSNTNDYRQSFSVVDNSSPSVKDYLIWMLVYPLLNLIPFIGTVIYLVFCFKFAFDKSYTARSNFFKATLICLAISMAISVILFVFSFVLSYFVFEDVSSITYEGYFA